MADGPRCKRRKQANPKRSSVTNFNNGPEASSDSDDEDKLHIVEEEGQEEKSHKKTKPVLPNGDCNRVKGKGGSEDDAEDGEDEEDEYEAEEEEEQKDALVQEILQQKDTAVIYPEAPEENTAETGGADENGTPDSMPLHVCPYCSRGYKRNASLKEHIKYRHETSDDNYSCTHCSYTFTYRSQLERHMHHHRSGKEPGRAKAQRHSQGSGGSVARKFKCNECTKAFKYKHHLKEHLRIHSGEKPYECANCKKRFSHSGSYSSHITSKKCAAAHFPNGLNHPPLKPQQVASTLALRKDGKADSKPLQEQIPLTQIKTEPMEEDIKPSLIPGLNGITRSGTALPQGIAMMVPSVGLVSPIGINISGLQNVFGKMLATGPQGKQGFMVQQPQQQVISLPAFVDHDGTTKIIINYSLSPAVANTATSLPSSLVVQNSPPAASTGPTVAAAPIPSRTEQSCAGEVQEFPTDLSISKVVKEEPDCVPISDDLGIVISKTESVAEMPKGTECSLCEECPEHMEAVHLLQHRKTANGEAVDSAALDPSFADLLSEAGVTLHQPNPNNDVLSVLKTAFAANTHPSSHEMEELAESVSIPAEVVQKWFTKMNRKAESEEDTSMEEASSEETDMDCQEDAEMPMNLKLRISPQKPKSKLKKKTVAQVKVETPDKDETQEDSESQEKAVSQANLELHNYSKRSEQETEPEDSKDSIDIKDSKDRKDSEDAEDADDADDSRPDSRPQPLDLTLPKAATPEPSSLEGTPEKKEESEKSESEKEEPEKAMTMVTVPPNVVVQPNLLQKLQSTPLNLACINKDQLEPRALYVTTPQSGNSNFVTATQIPTLVAIAGQGTVGCLSTINPTTKQRTILIPQLTYTYTPTANKGVLFNGVRTEKRDRVISQKGPLPAGGNEPKKKVDQGIYPCDICCKVFQKGSSLLRHKYEHTGRRPHECPICKKAFKHKHHLIEHARLHTGVKPYQCDRCGKRFSHSGSYSQHMNHRYSYCKRSVFNVPSPTSNTPFTPVSIAPAPAAEPEPTKTSTLLADYEWSDDEPIREESEEAVAEEEATEEAEDGVFEEEEVTYEEEEATYEEEEEEATYQEEEATYEEEEATYEEEEATYEEEEATYEEEEEAYEEEDAYDEEEEAMCVDDIRVVQVDEGEESGEEMEVELGAASEGESEGEAQGRDFRAGARRVYVRAK